MSKVEVGYFEADQISRELINTALDTGRISYGPLCRAVEDSMATMHDSRHGVVSASGTDSLRVALHAMKIVHGWEDGDEVIVPATTFVATVNIVMQLNMKPVFVDVLPKHYTMDPLKIEAAITDRTRAIIPVNLLGQAARMSMIMGIAIDYDLKVIEDSCEAMFVKHLGAMVGSWGDIGCFSFYMAHLITAGVGGVAVTSNSEYDDVMRSLLNHGRDTIYTSIDDDDNLSARAMREVAMRRFQFFHVGYSSRMTELQAALALPQLQKKDEMLARRRQAAGALTCRLSKHSALIELPEPDINNQHSWMMYGITMRTESKWPIMLHLEEAEIETRELLPLIGQPVYADLIISDDFPVSKKAVNSSFYIGSHQGLRPADIERVGLAFDNYFGGQI